MDISTENKKIAVLGDVHGEYQNFVGVLEKIGADRLNGNPDDGFHIIQLGDFLHLGHKKPEEDFFVKARPLVDELCLGNHEYPAVGGPTFWGYQDKDVVAYHLFKKDYKEKPWKVATSVGDWLITHAGMHPKLQAELYPQGQKAGVIAFDLNRKFHEFRERRESSHTPKWNETQDSGYKLFDAIDHWRGGIDPFGGIFWCDLNMLIAGYQDFQNKKFDIPLVKQIIGHSPQACPRNLVDDLWSIDVGGGIGYLVTEDEGQSWESGFVRDESSPFKVEGR